MMIVRRRLCFLAAVLSVAVKLLPTAVHAETAPVVVDTSLGPIEGVSEGGVDSFHGITFATVGERFSDSTLVETAWGPGGTLNATEFGPRCWPQSADSECLQLNLYRPASTGTTTTSEPKAVMVWIFGGGFVRGHPNGYDGFHMSLAQDIITVAINYRLSTEGFLVTGDSTNGAGGMNAMKDQVNGLRWVQQHIESFGGDPSQVTVFGQSAGGLSVCILCVSPLAKGLFKRAIVESGPCHGALSPNSPEVGVMIADKVVELANASSAQELADRAKYPTDNGIDSALPNIWDAYNALDGDLFIDGYYRASWTLDTAVLPGDPIDLFKDPAFLNPEEIIFGATSYDGVVGGLLQLGGWTIETASTNVTGFWDTRYDPQVAQQVKDLYQPATDDMVESILALIQSDGDMAYRCPSRDLADAAATVASKVYVYNFAFLSQMEDLLGVLPTLDQPTVASHTGELLFVGVDPIEVNLTEAETMMREEMMTRWANFAKTGDPSYPGGAEWTPVTHSGKVPAQVEHMSFQPGGGVMVDAMTHADHCAAFLSPTDEADGTDTETETTSAAGTSNLWWKNSGAGSATFMLSMIAGLTW